MKDEYVMGIDNGGIVIKVVIYDCKGQVFVIVLKFMQMLIFWEFYIECSIDELWVVNVEVIKKVIE